MIGKEPSNYKDTCKRVLATAAACDPPCGRARGSPPGPKAEFTLLFNTLLPITRKEHALPLLPAVWAQPRLRQNLLRPRGAPSARRLRCPRRSPARPSSCAGFWRRGRRRRQAPAGEVSRNPPPFPPPSKWLVPP